MDNKKAVEEFTKLARKCSSGYNPTITNAQRLAIIIVHNRLNALASERLRMEIKIAELEMELEELKKSTEIIIRD